MIIEIKNLPDGRKVKHINVDITFEEDNVPKVDTNINQVQHQQNKLIADAAPSVVSNTEHVSNVVVPPIISTDRVQKEVPPEMKDLEF